MILALSYLPRRQEGHGEGQGPMSSPAHCSPLSLAATVAAGLSVALWNLSPGASARQRALAVVPERGEVRTAERQPFPGEGLVDPA